MEINNSEAISVTANVADEDSVVALSQEKGKFSLQGKVSGKDEMMLELAGIPIKKSGCECS